MPTICHHKPTNDDTVRQGFRTNTNAELVLPIVGLVICKYTQKEQNIMGICPTQALVPNPVL